jgi:hypothetical protein
MYLCSNVVAHNREIYYYYFALIYIAIISAFGGWGWQVRSRLLGKIHFDLTYRFLMTKTLHRQQFFFTAKIDMNSTTVSSLENPYFRNHGRLKTDSINYSGLWSILWNYISAESFSGKFFVIQILSKFHSKIADIYIMYLTLMSKLVCFGGTNYP